MSTEVRLLALNAETLAHAKSKTKAINREAISISLAAYLDLLGPLLAASGFEKAPVDSARPRRMNSVDWASLTAWAGSSRAASPENRGHAQPLDLSAIVLLRACLQLTARLGVPNQEEATALSKEIRKVLKGKPAATRWAALAAAVASET